MLRAAASLLIMLLTASISCPGQETPDLANKFNEAKAQALNGNVSAQSELASMYRNGKGVPKDDVQAAFWYRKAAEKGNMDAQSSLGTIYFNGEGVPKDDSQATFWWHKSAEQGNAADQANLGIMYALGMGVEKNGTQAAFWYRKAADQGDARAQHNLGYMHEIGENVPKDETQAASWYRKAAEQGLVNSQFNLGIMYLNGRGVPKDEIEAYAWLNLASTTLEKAKSARDYAEKALTPEARMSAQARTRELQKLIAEQNSVTHIKKNRESSSTADTHKAKDAAREKDLEDRFNMALSFALKGDMVAQSFLGLFYAKGDGIAQDDEKAVYWWSKAAEQGHSDSQLLLGDMYSKGKGVAKDLTKALSWWRKAAEQGDNSAQLRIGASYAKGEGVPKDLVEGYAWINLASLSNADFKVAKDSVGNSMTPEARMRAQARTLELQKLIDERKAAKGR